MSNESANANGTFWQSNFQGESLVMSLKRLVFLLVEVHGGGTWSWTESLSGSFTMNFQRNKLIDVNFYRHFRGFTGFVKEIKHDKLKLLECFEATNEVRNQINLVPSWVNWIFSGFVGLVDTVNGLYPNGIF